MSENVFSVRVPDDDQMEIRDAKAMENFRTIFREKYLDVLPGLEKYVKKLAGDVESLRRLTEDNGMGLDEFAEEAGEIPVRIAGDINALYRRMDVRVCQPGILSVSDADTDRFRGVVREGYHVEAKFIDGMVCVRFPLLGNLYGRSRGGARNYSYVYSSDVRLAVGLLVKELNEKNVPYPSFAYKTLSYFFVVTDTGKEVCDAENRDTKTVTDAIVYAFGYGDGARFCSFFYDTIWLETGREPFTFAVLSDGKANPVPEETALVLIRKFAGDEEDLPDI